jgi:uncharacterized protein YsxB (DUF464 family)
MVEVRIERDEEGRIRAVSLKGNGGAEGLAAMALVEAPLLGMRYYLHLSPEASRADDGLSYTVDRSDPFLDRELDAILETMLLGLRALERDRPGSIVVREVGLDVKV